MSAVVASGAGSDSLTTDSLGAGSFTSGSLTAATSANFSVTHANASAMVWLTQPVAGRTGDRIQPQLKLVDFKGNTATSTVPASITASVFTGSNGSVVNATGTISAGIITFSDLQLVGTPGTAYTIKVTAVIGGGSVASPASSLSLIHI